MEGSTGGSERKTRYDHMIASLFSFVPSQSSSPSILFLFHRRMKRFSIISRKTGNIQYIRGCSPSSSPSPRLIHPSKCRPLRPPLYYRANSSKSACCTYIRRQLASLEEYIADAVTIFDTVRSSSSVSFHSDLAPKLEPPYIIARHIFPPTGYHPPSICMRFSFSEHYVLPSCPL